MLARELTDSVHQRFQFESAETLLTDPGPSTTSLLTDVARRIQQNPSPSRSASAAAAAAAPTATPVLWYAQISSNSSALTNFWNVHPAMHALQLDAELYPPTMLAQLLLRACQVSAVKLDALPNPLFGAGVPPVPTAAPLLQSHALLVPADPHIASAAHVRFTDDLQFRL